MGRRHKLLILTVTLLFGGILTTAKRPGPDPFIYAKVQPYAVNFNGEPKFSSQFHFNHFNRGNIYNYYDGSGVTVAIIDSGINVDHEDFWNDNLQTNITSSSAYIEERGDKHSNIVIQTVANKGINIIDDEDGHGTAVAGTVGALINGVGTAGVSPGVNLMVLKTNYWFTEIERAIRYAADNGAHIINMSLGAYETTFIDGYGDEQEGIPGASTYFQSAINYAFNKGVTLIAAAGNEKTSERSYPASNSNVIGVGALGRNSSSSMAGFSNYGTHNVTLVAPGYVYVTDNTGANKYSETQGTSFAAPIVASGAALYKQRNPFATPAQVTQALIDSATDMGTPGNDSTYGYGRLNLTALLPGVPVTGVEISPKNKTIDIGESFQLDINILPSNATNKEYIVVADDETIVDVTDEGLVTGLQVGTTEITVLTDDGMFEDTMTITVRDALEPIAVTNIVNNDGNISLGVGATKQLNLTISPQGALYSDLIFSSSDSVIVSVNNEGLITANSNGSAYINITSKVGPATLTIPVNVYNLTPKTVAYSFTSKSWAATPTSWLSGKDGNGFDNNGVQVTTGTSGANAISPISYENIQSIVVGYATNAAKGAGNIAIYSLSDKNNLSNRIKVGEFSVTTAGGTTRRETTVYVPSGAAEDGYIQIEVTTTTNSIYICDITINYKEVPPAPVAVTGINLTTGHTNLYIGETVTTIYNVLPSNATNKNVSFTSTNPLVASVNANGVVTALSIGTTIISVITNEGAFTKTFTVTVNERILVEPTLNLITTNFKTHYAFGESLDIQNISAIYTDEENNPSTISGSNLTLISGNTKILGSSLLTFSYQGITASVVINVTNIGSENSKVPGMSHSLTLTGSSFTPSLTDKAKDYAAIVSNSFTFSGNRLRKLANSNNFFIAEGGHFANNTPFDEIVSIKFDYLSGGSAKAKQTVYFASRVDGFNAATEVINSSTGNTSKTVIAPVGMKYFHIEIDEANLQANITINYKSGGALTYTFNEQATAYYDYFMAVTHEECLISDVQSITWDHLKDEYNAMSIGAQSIVKSLAVNGLGARYNLIINGYGYDDYMVTANASNRVNDPWSSEAFALISVISLALISSYFLMINRRKKN